MTQGKPMKVLLGFTIPVFIGNVFQQFYNMVDAVVVGKFVGTKALAAVGSTGTIIFLIIGFLLGLTAGFTVLTAQKYGAGKMDEMRQTVGNALILTAVISAVMTAVSMTGMHALLKFMHTPDDIFKDAYAYVMIICGGIFAQALYNILASILRALGNSKVPLYFLILSAMLNIVLDLVFVLVFDMGVEGPAIATVLAQGVSGIICLWYMYRKFPVLHASREEWRPEFSYMGKLCYIGIPMGLQYSVTAIGTLVLQAAVNGLGAAVVAGVTAGQKINAFIQCPLEALGQTMAPYAGQNMGAEKYDRIGKGLKSAVGMGFAVSVLCFVLAIFFGKQLTMLFVDSSETTIISYSYQFLLYCTGGYCLLTLVNTVRFTIQGMGFSVFAILSGIMEMIARILAATVVVQMIGFAGTCLAHPMAWLFADVFLIPAFFWCRKKVAKQG